MSHCDKHGEYSVFCRYCDADVIEKAKMTTDHAHPGTPEDQDRAAFEQDQYPDHAHLRALAETPKEVPILEQLRKVPLDARCIYEHGRYESENIPFGRMAKDAADTIERLTKERDALRNAALALLSNEDHRKETGASGNYQKGSPTWELWQDLRNAAIKKEKP